jgi:DNA-binding response OmpR family regulator
MRVLLVEDDQQIADFLFRALSAEGHHCVIAHTGPEGLTLARNGDFELILLDLMLPEISGLDVCRELRTRHVLTPIIMLTAMDSSEDVITGLKAGADDYVTKPFDIDELLARMDTVSRRGAATIQTRSRVTIDDVIMDMESKTVTVNGVNVQLTARELSVLELLMSSPKKLCTRERILNNVWGLNADPLTNVVDVYMGRIRKKLGKDKSPFIETVRGLGYRIHPGVLD